MPTKSKRTEEIQNLITQAIEYNKRGYNAREISKLIPRSKSWIASKIRLSKQS